MKNKTFTKGKANRVTLAERMKKYEAVTTGTTLIERLPIYARIDMRAGHTWCRDLIKPFDPDYCNAMKVATSYVVEKTGALVGYCQSDEASFVWLDSSKTPFETRLFKLQSILSSMFTAAFIKSCVNTKLWNKIENGKLPSFDCRVCNMPSLDEASNMILWREQDSIKNSITLLALEHFSDKEIHKKNSVDKIEMLKEKGVNYYTTIPEDLRNGAYFRRELYYKELSEDELSRIPENKLPKKNSDGKYYVIRSKVVQFNFGCKLQELENKVEALFYGAPPEQIPVNAA